MMIRRVIQALFVFIVFYLALQHQWYGIEKAAPIDGFCPYGGVVNALPLILKGEFLKRIFWGSIILMIVTSILTILFGRVFCGFFCPLGTLQELMRKIGGKLGLKKEIQIPDKTENSLRLIKYFVFLLSVALTYKTGTLVFREFDPFVALIHYGREFEELMYGYIILIVVLLIGLFYKNIWCRYLCPLGAYYGILKKFSLFKLKRDSKKCIDCGKCNQYCPHAIDVQHVDNITSSDCVSCLECVAACPVDCLEPKIHTKIIKNTNKFSATIFIIFTLIISSTMIFGLWQSASPSNLVKNDGSFDVSNIRGSNTLKTIMDTTGIHLEYFQKNLGLPKDVDTSLMLKDIGPHYGISNSEGNPLTTDDFRRAIAKKIGVEYAGENH